VRKTNNVEGWVWGRGERKWGGNFMIKSILMEGAEIWG
jgi:hypothetical protein